ncbi:MAG: citrate lyase acyl carrier protein [Erysipelotrichaceae bacterium]|nr:citrate lyase acyl carrier protein [Erysipelotrichaceae bacterium]
MEIKHSATAGTHESSDIMVFVEPNEEGSIIFELDSPVKSQFGEQIRDLVHSIFQKVGITHVKVTAVDHGALDYAIIARMLTAIARASDCEESLLWRYCNDTAK